MPFSGPIRPAQYTIINDQKMAVCGESKDEFSVMKRKPIRKATLLHRG